MSRTADDLYGLLPAIYRIRDAEIASRNGGGRGPLWELLAVITEQIAVLEENVEQLYDDQFIETCADWVVPYIGDLIGYRPLHGAVPTVASSRAEVAHTIAFRRRKGTASMLEQLAQDVTGWPARVVEFFQLLATTQYMNHLRPGSPYAPDLRRWEPLERLGTAFDSLPHTVDVRRIQSRRGRYNVPNIGVFLWRLTAYSLTGSPAVQAGLRRYRFSPLDNDIPLFTRPQREDEITHLAEPINVPAPISRRVLREYLDDYYGPTESKSLSLIVDDVAIPASDIVVCNLEDANGGWAHPAPDGKYAIDPELGRIALHRNVSSRPKVTVRFHYGFSADIGGGEYEREVSGARTVAVPDDHTTIQGAIDALGREGIIEITDSGRYEEAITINVAPRKRLVVRAANGRRPTLVLSGRMVLRGGAESEVVLDGLLVRERRMQIPRTGGNELRRLVVRHCTLVPGLSLDDDGAPQSPGEPSVVVERQGCELHIQRSIVGSLHVDAQASACITDSIIDATTTQGAAYADPGDGYGGPLTVQACTVVGTVDARVVHISNSICTSLVIAERRQEGCARFSYLPLDSRVSRRHRCVPHDTSANVAPQFASLRYGTPSYCRLHPLTAEVIRRGADDEGEMGAFHHLYQPQRESNLNTRLDEYLRVGLEAGILYET